MCSSACCSDLVIWLRAIRFFNVMKKLHAPLDVSSLLVVFSSTFFLALVWIQTVGTFETAEWRSEQKNGHRFGDFCLKSWFSSQYDSGGKSVFPVSRGKRVLRGLAHGLPCQTVCSYLSYPPPWVTSCLIFSNRQFTWQHSFWSFWESQAKNKQPPCHRNHFHPPSLN